MQSFEKLLNLTGVQIDDLQISDNTVTIKCSSFLEEGICPCCQNKSKRITKYYERSLRDMKVFDKETNLKLKVRQFKCQSCEVYFNERFAFSDPRYQMTGRYREYIYRCCQGRDIKHVARQEGLAWDTVSGIYEDMVKKNTGNMEL